MKKLLAIACALVALAMAPAGSASVAEGYEIQKSSNIGVTSKSVGDISRPAGMGQVKRTAAYGANVFTIKTYSGTDIAGTGIIYTPGAGSGKFKFVSTGGIGLKPGGAVSGEHSIVMNHSVSNKLAGGQVAGAKTVGDVTVGKASRGDSGGMTLVGMRGVDIELVTKYRAKLVYYGDYMRALRI